LAITGEKMNKQDLVERANLINAQLEQTKQQFNTLTAHLNECNFWLAKFNELEAQVKEDAVVDAQPEDENGGQEVDCGSNQE
jgi:prefoldin subunit 5